MRSQPLNEEWLTVHQLLGNILVMVILGALWMAYYNQQKLQQQTQSEAVLLPHG
jgi:hypothetical protein